MSAWTGYLMKAMEDERRRDTDRKHPLGATVISEGRRSLYSVSLQDLFDSKITQMPY